MGGPGRGAGTAGLPAASSQPTEIQRRMHGFPSPACAQHPGLGDGCVSGREQQGAGSREKHRLTEVLGQLLAAPSLWPQSCHLSSLGLHIVPGLAPSPPTSAVFPGSKVFLTAPRPGPRTN